MRHRHGRRASTQERQVRDRGQTFVEILVSIVLLGTAVGGTLTALRTTIVSSAVDDDQSKANAWLLAAEEAVYRAPYKPCPTNNVAQVKSAYDLEVQATTPPGGWVVGVNQVSFWSKSDGQEVWSTVCGTERSPQLVEIYVLSPSGDVAKTRQVVKGGG